MKNILITGARGFIGSNLKILLQSSGRDYKVFAPSHSELDLLDQSKVRDYVLSNSIDIVVHAANVGGNRKSSDENTMADNLRMFFNIAGIKDKVEKIIHLGSGAEYDKRNPLNQVREEEFGSSIPVDAYGFSKYIISEYIRGNENIICLRLFGVFGIGEDYEYKFISNSIVKNIFNIPINIMQNVYFDYLYVQDCIRAIEWFINNDPAERFYNLASGKRTDLLTLAQIVNSCGVNNVPVTVKNPGFNNEYTASSGRIEREAGIIMRTSYEDAVKEMYKFYLSSINQIDYNRIAKDTYAEKIVVRKDQ